MEVNTLPTYKYKALNLKSKTVSGKIEANDYDNLLLLLREKNMFLLDYRDISKKEPKKFKLKLNQLSAFSREIGTMIGAGLPLIRILSIMVDREENKKVKELYSNIYTNLQQGHTLSSALEMQNGAFPELLIQMYRTGEESGQLKKVAMTMADQYSREHKLNNKIKLASTYPAILAVLTIVAVFAIYTFIMPKFADVFGDMDLPLITKINLAISNFLTENVTIVIFGILILAAILVVAMQQPSVKYKVDCFKIRAPKMGKLMKVIYTARFARTLCSLYTSGLSLVYGLRIAEKTIGNKFVEEQLDEAIQRIRAGESLSAAFSIIEGFDVKLISSIFVGEESGHLEDMLTVLADDYDYEAEVASQRLVSLMEPVMIVIMGLVIGSVMLSVLLPIITIYQNGGM